jgi:biopolymer transport protein ExbB/TolQ
MKIFDRPVVLTLWNWLKARLPGGLRVADKARRHYLRTHGVLDLRGPVLLRAFLAGLVLVVISYGAVNFWIASSIDEEFENLVIEELSGCGTAERGAAKLVDIGWAPSNLKDWLQEGLGSTPASTPAREQISVFLDKVLSHEEGKREQRDNILRDHATGRRTSLVAGLPWIRSRPVSGPEIFEALTTFDGGTWLTELERPGTQFSAEKKAFLKRYLSAIASQMNPRLRGLWRVNGLIQWFVVLLFWSLAWLSIQRWCLERKLRRKWLEPFQRDGRPPALAEGADLRDIWMRIRRRVAENPDGRPSVEILQAETGQLRDSIENDVYEPLGFLVGIIPALGFIGTVLGMGNALLAADGLFSAADRQLTVSQITKQLGFAFDTTLLALVLSSIVGLMLAATRVRERRFIRDAERAISRSLSQIDSEEAPLR